MIYAHNHVLMSTDATREIVRTIVIAVGILIVLSVVGYLLTGSMTAGIGAIAGVIAIAYALYTLRNLLGL